MGERVRSDVARAPAMAALVLVTGVGPLATDTYVAGLPALQRSLSTSAAVAQLTLTAFIVGVALGQLALGPMSDGRGRRPFLLGGTLAFAVLSAACALAPTGPALVVARLGQGVVAGCGVAVGRAVVSDHWHGSAAAARFGTLAAITYLGPVLAPAVGAVVLAHGTWRTVFALLTVVGLAMVVAVLRGIPESLPVSARQGNGLSSSLARMSDLLRDRGFMRHVIVQCLATAGFFTYIGGSAFVLQTTYGTSQTTYAVLFATNAAAMVVASVGFRAVVERVGPAPLRTVGVTVATVASVALVAVALGQPHVGSSLVLPWVLLCLVVAGMGLSIPGTMALAQEAGRRSRGTASALQGGLTFLVGAAVTPLTGLVGYDTLLPMALLMAGFFVAASVWLHASGSARA